MSWAVKIFYNQTARDHPAGINDEPLYKKGSTNIIINPHDKPIFITFQ